MLKHVGQEPNTWKAPNRKDGTQVLPAVCSQESSLRARVYFIHHCGPGTQCSELFHKYLLRINNFIILAWPMNFLAN